MTSVKEIEDEMAELTGTRAQDWGYAMTPCLVLDHPTAGRFILFGNLLHKIVPLDADKMRAEQKAKAALAAPVLALRGAI